MSTLSAENLELRIVDREGTPMTTLAPETPWVLRLVTDRLPVGPPPYATVTLDPVTRTARYADSAGRPGRNRAPLGQPPVARAVHLHKGRGSEHPE